MQPYSPSRRTALVLTGTGAHGAYHAGVLRALQEAGVKIDVSRGTVSEPAVRLWPRSMARRASGIRRESGGRARAAVVHVAAAAASRPPGSRLVLATILLTPLVVLLAGLLVYLVGFLFEMLQLEAGRALVVRVLGVAANRVCG